MNHLALNLDTAEQALRDNLHVHGLDPLARSHMQRALCHVREAFIGITQSGQARTVEQLVAEQATFERQMAATFKLARAHEQTIAPRKGIRLRD